ncbi:MAG: hypothetical protein VKK59_04675 [Vampirovibrionales bacterium]|nr:hypothetical protein [Vampirovibrionales bacterium]
MSHFPHESSSVSEKSSPKAPKPQKNEVSDTHSGKRSHPLVSRLEANSHRVLVLEGWKGLMTLAGMIVLVIALLLSIPGALAMVIWNAVIHETFSGPAIAFHQGVLLALMGMITFHLVFRPRYLNIAFECGEP